MLRCEANAKVVLFDGDNVIVDDPKLEGSPVATFNYGQDILNLSLRQMQRINLIN